MSRRQGRRYSQAWRNGTKVVLPPLIKSVMKRDWEGYQHFPREGGMLVASNHLSYGTGRRCRCTCTRPGATRLS